MITFFTTLKTKNAQFFLDNQIIFLILSFLQANMCKDPSDIFNYMFDQKIGNELSCFYESWAWILEQMGNTKKANLIYQEGIKRRSEPMDLLERKYK